MPPTTRLPMWVPFCHAVVRGAKFPFVYFLYVIATAQIVCFTHCVRVLRELVLINDEHPSFLQTL